MKRSEQPWRHGMRPVIRKVEPTRRFQQVRGPIFGYTVPYCFREVLLGKSGRFSAFSGASTRPEVA